LVIVSRSISGTRGERFRLETFMDDPAEALEAAGPSE
jgi:hypothetical protein